MDLKALFIDPLQDQLKAERKEAFDRLNVALHDFVDSLDEKIEAAIRKIAACDIPDDHATMQEIRDSLKFSMDNIDIRPLKLTKDVLEGLDGYRRLHAYCRDGTNDIFCEIIADATMTDQIKKPAGFLAILNVELPYTRSYMRNCEQTYMCATYPVPAYIPPATPLPTVKNTLKSYEIEDIDNALSQLAMTLDTSLQQAAARSATAESVEDKAAKKTLRGEAKKILHFEFDEEKLDVADLSQQVLENMGGYRQLHAKCKEANIACHFNVKSSSTMGAAPVTTLAVQFAPHAEYKASTLSIHHARRTEQLQAAMEDPAATPVSALHKQSEVNGMIGQAVSNGAAAKKPAP